MGTTVALLDAVAHRAWPVISVAVVMVLLRIRLFKAICWNLVLRALKVPLPERQSIMRRVARDDLGLSAPDAGPPRGRRRGKRGRARTSSPARRP